MCPPEEEENNGSTPPKRANRAVSEKARFASLLKRAMPFLRDEAAKYEDDGNNEPLELAISIEAALRDYED